MFEAVIAMCVAYEISGKAVNPCWMRQADQVFRTYEACRSWGNEQELQMISKAVRDYNASAVVHIACGEMNGDDT
tara:strand:+ start:32 stop:256 length:225 start_codon:yes stop_codon:yes gene_type:complete